MQYKNFKKGTVLIYTMVLVVLGVFMATVVLNVATQLSVEYDKRNIEISLLNIIESKGDLSMKYARELNKTGSGFVDNISCPQDISMSGAVVSGRVDTQLRYLSGSVICLGVYDASDLKLSFNSTFDDLAFAEYQGYQILVNSGSLTGVFGNTDATYLDIENTDYLSSDDVDDNFDSDNFSVFSTGSIAYPDGYIDNDADARLLNYGYVIENTGLYNAFWSNSKMKKYIADNPHNNDAINAKLGTTGSGYLHLDINAAHRLVLYVIDRTTYNESNELLIEQTITGTGQTAGIGYLKDDLSLGTGSVDAYNFDFASHDYALFVENTSSGALLYQIRGEDASTASGVYLSPLKDNDISVFSFLGSHMLVDEEGRLIGDQFEVFGLK